MAKGNNMILVDIEEIKQMKKKGFLGWSKYLLPYCHKYFDAGYSITQIKDKLLTLYEFEISISTLNRLLLKYRLMDNDSKPSGLPATLPSIANPVKSEISIEQKKVEEEKIQPSKEEEDLKELVEAYNNHRLSRTQRKDPLDDLIAKQQRDKLLREQQAPPNE